MRRPTFGDGDEEFSVTDADVRPRARSRLPRILGMAAVLVLIVAAVFAAPRFAPQAQVLFEKTLALIQAQTDSPAEADAAARGPTPLPPREKKAEKRTLAKRQSGVVLVQSNKPALVMENGEELGSTPLKLTRPAGKRRLEVFSADGKTARVVDVEIISGKEVVADVALP